MTQVSRRKIEILLAKPSDDLYASISSLVRFPQKAPLRPASHKVIKAAPRKQSSALQASRGRAGFKRISPELFNAICIKWQYCEKKESSPLVDRVALVAMVADAIAGYCGAFPPLTIAVLLVKMGLSRFCRCQERALRKDTKVRK